MYEFEWKGKFYNLKEFAAFLGISRRALSNRLDKAKTMDEVVNYRKNFTYQGKRYSLYELAKISGVTYRTFQSRLRLTNNNIDAAIHFGKHFINGKWLTIREMSKIAGVSYQTMLTRTYLEDDSENILRPGKKCHKLTAEEKRDYMHKYNRECQQKNKLKLKEYHREWYLRTKQLKEEQDAAD